MTPELKSADPLSEILDLLDARCVMSGGLIAGGAWALRFARPGVVKIMAVAEGACWMMVEGMAPTRLDTGDVILVDGRRSFVLTTDQALEAREASTVFAEKIDGVAQIGDHRSFVMLGGHVALDPARATLLLDVLPPVIHVGHDSDEALALQWLVKQLVREVNGDHPGNALATSQLAQLMFVQALRAHLQNAGSVAGGWLRGLGDDRIAQALRLMHAEPARAWTLGELAKAVAMSRTAFALRFKMLVGVAPLSYLLGWRMHLAGRDLRESDRAVSEIAFALGYTSESAFSNAFKREMGKAPKRYRTAFRNVA